MTYLHYSTEFLPRTIPEKTNLIFHQIKTACKAHSPSTFGKGLDRLLLASLVTQYTLTLFVFHTPVIPQLVWFKLVFFGLKRPFSHFLNSLKPLQSLHFLGSIIMELRGVEPLSENPFIVLLQA